MPLFVMATTREAGLSEVGVRIRIAGDTSLGDAVLRSVRGFW